MCDNWDILIAILELVSGISVQPSCKINVSGSTHCLHINSLWKKSEFVTI
jgi:hypothetical protein